LINPDGLTTDQEYFSDETYFSVSRFKAFERCEVGAMSDERYESTAMLVGSYVDAYISGTLEQFKEEHPEIISSRGATKGQLKSEFKVADEVIEKISNDTIFQQFLSGEKQVTMTGEISGVPFKIKIDSYSEGKAIVDLKVMASITRRDGQYFDFITPWGYDVQGAVYQEIVRQNTGQQLPFFIAVATKENPVNTAIIQIPQLILDRALYRVESQVERFYKVMQGEEEPVGCGVCSACISRRKETPIISMEDILEGGLI
jgi:hypothetical protein